jgi:hypothetical protein
MYVWIFEHHCCCEGKTSIAKEKLRYLINTLSAISKMRRRILLACHFGPNPNYTPPLYPKLENTINKWMPEHNKNYTTQVDAYIKQCELRATAVIHNLRAPLPPASHKFILSTLRQLNDRTDIRILPADKNVNMSVLSSERYHILAKGLLPEAEFRRIPVEQYNHNQIYAKLRIILNKHNMLFSPNAIRTNKGACVLSPLAESLLQLQNTPTLRIPVFYILPKLHKTPISARPIVSSINSVTYHPSLYLHNCFQRLRCLIPTICTRSSDVILDLQHYIPTPTQVIVCADVRSLYPSIPIDYGMQCVKKFLTRVCHTHNTILQPDEIPLILDILHWVLTNGYLQYDQDIYLQLTGTAMGTPVACTYADIVLSFNDDACMLLTPTPYYYRRYIDDLFIICERSIANSIITTFNSLSPNIQLDPTSVSIELSGIFLDIYATLSDNCVVTSIYYKPINNFLFLSPYSNHKKSVFSSVIASRIKRLRTYCSADTDFLHNLQLLYQRYLKRGYSHSMLRPHFGIRPSRTLLLDELRTKRSNKSKLLKSSRNIYITTQQYNSNIKIPWKHILSIPQSLSSNPYFKRAYPVPRIIIGATHPPNASYYLSRKRNLLETKSSTSKRTSPYTLTGPDAKRQRVTNNNNN